jgi:hypothetical protein
MAVTRCVPGMNYWRLKNVRFQIMSHCVGRSVATFLDTSSAVLCILQKLRSDDHGKSYLLHLRSVFGRRDCLSHNVIPAVRSPDGPYR